MIASNEPTQEPKRLRKVVVLGGGSAGFLVALALRKKLPFLEVEVVRSTKIGVIGVGEGTIISVVRFLHRFLGLETQRFHDRARPTIKLGIRFLWGKRPYFHYTFSPQLSGPLTDFSLPRPYYCEDEFDFADLTAALMVQDKVCLRRVDGAPRFPSSVAYHLENRRFVAYLEDLATEAGINKIDDIVQHVDVGEEGVKALVLGSGQRVTGDLFVDCSGFRSELLGQALAEPFVSFKQALFCDRAVVGDWKRTDEPIHPYTTAETMQAGWCWRIEHESLINRGYVYSSDFLSEEQATEEYVRLNPKVERTHTIKFRSGSFQRTWVKNVVALGNSAGFVEPLESTAIGMICDGALHLVRTLIASNGVVLPIQRDVYNRIVGKNWDIIRDFLAIHYRFNDRYDSDFWKACRNDVDLGDMRMMMEYYQKVGPDLSVFAHEFKRDIFSSEGYFVMLVGQKIPYAARRSVDPSELERWKARKEEMLRRASAGMGMQECMKLLREGGLTGAPSDRPGVVIDGSPMEGVDIGELAWH